MNLLSLHHASVEVPDLAGLERFAASFGFIEAGRSGADVFYRTRGRDAYSLVARVGAQRRLSEIAFRVASRADLEQAVREHGASPIRALTGPGGGEAVSLQDPEGNTVVLVHGVAERTPEPVRAPQKTNHPSQVQRYNAEHDYPELGPSHLLRIGHIGLFIQDFAAIADWYTRVLGLVFSDRIYAGDPSHYIGGFMRLNRGKSHVDHHVIALFAMGKREVHHLSFEVPDAEHQFIAHRHLLREGWEAVWGVGRHPKGSHVFDVWKDPNGLRFETFTDTDLVNEERPTEDHPIERMEMDMWSNEPPTKYFA
jgi:catechol 2,3-dioxygenase-like lactoylglutathione lyase family enzyme